MYYLPYLLLREKNILNENAYHYSPKILTYDFKEFCIKNKLFCNDNEWKKKPKDKLYRVPSVDLESNNFSHGQLFCVTYSWVKKPDYSYN